MLWLGNGGEGGGRRAEDQDRGSSSVKTGVLPALPVGYLQCLLKRSVGYVVVE